MEPSTPPAEMTNLLCPNCGAALHVDADARQATCAHCGTTQLIHAPLPAGDQALRAARLIRLEGEIEQNRRAMVRAAQWVLLGLFCLGIHFFLVRFIFFAVLGALFLLAGGFLLSLTWRRRRALLAERDS